MDARSWAMVALIAVVLFAGAAPVWAQGTVDTQKAEQESATVVKLILRILLKWVAPLLAITSFFYGLCKGFKRGEWDYAALCIIAGIAIALFPKIIIAIFGISPGDVGFAN